MRVLKVDKINVSYGDAQVLYDLSIEVNEGEIVTVIGSNGAGKTTLLRAISGIIPMQSGEITFNGVSIKALKAFNLVTHRITMVPERASFISCNDR